MGIRSSRTAYALVVVMGAFAFVALACGALLGNDEDASSSSSSGNAGDGSNPNGDDATTAGGGGDGSSDGAPSAVDAAGKIPCGQTACAPSTEQCCWFPSGAMQPGCRPVGGTCGNGGVPLTCVYDVGCEAGPCCVGYAPDGGPLGASCACFDTSGTNVYFALCGAAKATCQFGYSCEIADAYPPEYDTCQKPFQ